MHRFIFTYSIRIVLSRLLLWLPWSIIAVLDSILHFNTVVSSEILLFTYKIKLFEWIMYFVNGLCTESKQKVCHVNHVSLGQPHWAMPSFESSHFNKKNCLHCTMNLLFTLCLHFVIMEGFASVQNSKLALNRYILSRIAHILIT